MTTGRSERETAGTARLTTAELVEAAAELPPIVDPDGNPATLHAAIVAMGSKVWDPPAVDDSGLPGTSPLRFFVVGYAWDGERWSEHRPKTPATPEDVTTLERPGATL